MLIMVRQRWTRWREGKIHLAFIVEDRCIGRVARGAVPMPIERKSNEKAKKEQRKV
jgi:hypothetical protein